MVQTFDVVVIGSGPGGYVAAIRAAQLELKTACVEKEKPLGGTCLNVGCIPSKALLHSSELYWKFKHEGALHGLIADPIRFNFDAMMQRKNGIVASFNDGIAALFKKNKITHLQGLATLRSPHEIQLSNGEMIQAQSIILATGSQPIPLPFLPFDERRVVSSTGALTLEQVPKRLLVVGAGVIGVELGSVYARLGADVTFVEFLDRICPTLDESLSKELQKQLTAQGMHFNLSSKVIGADIRPSEITLRVELPSKEQREFSTDIVLVCIGRRAYTTGLGLENVALATDPKGLIPVDNLFRTTIPSIYAIGDLIDGPMLAHKASEEGVAAAEIIAGHHPKIHYAAIPNVVYTNPEVACVGLTEAEAKQFGISTRAGTFHFKANSRARCTGEEAGFVKILVEEKKGTIIGVHIIGAHASELIAEAALAIQEKLRADQIADTPHAHPTLSEALKEAALATQNRAIHK